MAGGKRGGRSGSRGGRHGSTKDTERLSANSGSDAQVSENLLPLGPGMSSVTLDQSAPPQSDESGMAAAAAAGAGAAGVTEEPAPHITRSKLARDSSQSRRNDYDHNDHLDHNEDTTNDIINNAHSASEGSDDDDDVLSSVATDTLDTPAMILRPQLSQSGIHIAVPSPAVIPDNPTVKDLMSVIISNHAETTATLQNIGARLQDFEVSLDMAHSRASKNENDIKTLQKENHSLKKTVETLTSQLREMHDDVVAVRDRQEASERRSREWGIRIHGVPETAKEDTRLVLCRLIANHKLAGLDTVERASQVIEHCHRLGPKASGKHRVIIANIFSRPMRNLLIKDARVIKNDATSSVYIAEDMTKQDHELKLMARAQMRQAYDNGHKVFFRKGKLFIDSQEVPIKRT